MQNTMNAYNFQTIAKQARKGRRHSVELVPIHENRKSYYKKAYIIVFDNGLKVLQSYSTYVAAVLPDGRFLSFGNWSATTRRHQWEFCLQYANKSEWQTSTLNDFETNMYFHW